MNERVNDGYRLSPQQARIWRLQTADGDRVYAARAALLLAGEVDEAAVPAAVQRLVDRHEILRTTFRRVAGLTLPLQHAGEGAWRWGGVREAGDDWAAEVESFVRVGAPLPADLADGPSFAASLLRCPGRRWVLLASLPALCADGASLRNLVAELARCWRPGPAADEPAEPLQYADLAEWQHQFLESPEMQEGRAYWQRQDLRRLQALPEALFPALTYSASPEPPAAAAALSVAFGGELTARLEELAAGAGVDLAAWILAGWLILLRRLTRDGEVTVAVAGEGRNYDGLAAALGPLTRYVPLRSAAAGAGEDWPAAARRVHAGLAEAFQWQECLGWDELESAAGEPGYFPLGFDYEDRRAVCPAGGATLSLLDGTSRVDRFLLLLSAAREPAGLRLHLDYDGNRLSRRRMERLREELETLVRGAAERPWAAVEELEIVGVAERRWLLAEREAVPPAAGPCVHQLFARQAALHPERPAAVAGGERITYGELARRAAALARRLVGCGVGADAVVGLCAERSVDLLVGILGILEAGGAYVALDPAFPEGRLAHHLADARPAVLVTQTGLAERMAGFDGELVLLDSGDSPPADAACRALTAALPDSLAYVLYTSGSTGAPKGVAVGHASLTHYSEVTLRALGIDRPLHFLTAASFAADLGNTAIFPALISGGCVHLLDHETATDAVAFARYAAAHGAGLLKITPSHLAALLGAGGHRDVLPAEWLVVGGEPLPFDLVKRIEAAGATCRVLNEYGPTEATVGMITYVWPGADAAPAAAATVPIGSPFAGARAYVLDRRLRLLPAGAPGELYLAGRCLARGYLGRPSQTAERFLPDPFTAEGSARMYRTGDLVRQLPGGELEFLGRADDQVKIRGFRVEPGEVAAALREHPQVRDAAVVAAGPREVPRLIAYVVGSREQGPGGDALRGFLEAKLPEFMVPSAYVPVPSLPLTPNGKLDRAALPPPDLASSSQRAEYAPPGSDIEVALAGVWQQVLGVERVGLDDNFFSLGGDSIRCIQVRYLAKERGLELSTQELFEQPTIRGLAPLARRGPANPEELLARLDQLSGDQVDSLLGELLAAGGEAAR